MKHILLSAAAVLTMVGLAIAPAPTTHATTYANDADVALIEKSAKSLKAFESEVSNSSTTATSVATKASAAQSDLRALQSHSFTTQLGPNYTTQATALKGTIPAIITSIDSIVSAVNASDETAYNTAATKYETAISAYNTALNKLDTAVTNQNKVVASDTSTKGSLYLIALIATGILSVAAFIWAFATKSANQQLSAAKRAVAISTLWPLAGALITFATFTWAAQNGGSYTIVYGAIIVGLILFAQSVANYLKVKKYSSIPPQV